jgi:transcriptional regulator with XRE-family HTH domain
MNNAPEIVGKNVRRYRNKRGLSQEALADLAGLHRTYILKVEQGKTNISINNLFRLASALKLDPKLLLDTKL